ncbi:MAG: universal stress protein [Bacteroidota bacterium]
MVNILVPIDFSDLSRVAVQYAVKIANKLGGNVTLLHVVNITQTVRATMRLKVKSLERDLIRGAKEDMDDLLKEVSKHVKTSQPIKYKVVRGASFNETVRRSARRLRSGLIIMGTKGAGGLKKVVMGSNTTSIIEVSHIPVLAVPAHAQFKSIRNIVYACDLKNLEKELKKLIPYVEKFGCTVHILHIVSSGRDVETTEEKIEKIVQKLGYDNIVALVLVDQNIDGAIDQYIDVSKADMLAMFTHDLNFYEKLFDRSYTRRMAFHSKIPLLAFKGN